MNEATAGRDPYGAPQEPVPAAVVTGEPQPVGGGAARPRAWDGAWVTQRLGVSVESVGSLVGVRVDQLVGMAVRRNPRRAHLLVSTVLGKHVPTDPRIVYSSGRLLGELTRAVLDRRPRTDRTSGRLLELALAGDAAAAAALQERTEQPPAQLAGEDADTTTSLPAAGLGSADGSVVVLGFAETATALGHTVADALHAPYLHSTRRPVPGLAPLTGFEEEHSHATSHLLLPERESILTDADTVVLVDDELSTGATALNTIRALHASRPRSRYVIASLVDLRSEQDRRRMQEAAQHLHTRIEVAALAAGRVHLPEDILTRGKAVVDALTDPGAGPTSPASGSPARRAHVRRMPPLWPTAAKDGARHGFTPKDRSATEHAAEAVADAICTHLDANLDAHLDAPRRRLHVLAFEELMYAPLRIACHLAKTQHVTYSSTTRSPVLPVSSTGYAIRTACTFPAHDRPSDGPGPRFAYNLPTEVDAYVLVVDDHADTPQLHAPGGLVDHLAAAAPEVLLVAVPSYRPDFAASSPGRLTRANHASAPDRRNAGPTRAAENGPTR